MSYNLFITLETNEMPIFRPNDFFFANHQREGEEKWQTFARVVRDIIREGSGNAIQIAYHDDGSEIDIREKLEYKELLWPSKKKDTKPKQE